MVYRCWLSDIRLLFAIVPAGTLLFITAALCISTFIQSKLSKLAEDERPNPYFDFNNLIMICLFFTSKVQFSVSSTHKNNLNLIKTSFPSDYMGVCVYGHDTNSNRYFIFEFYVCIDLLHFEYLLWIYHTHIFNTFGKG
jgi:hypothetical protein